MPLLGSCCIVFDLKVGTKIIGVIKLIGAILTTLSVAGALAMLTLMDVSVSLADAVHEEHRRNFLKDVEDDYDDYMDTRDVEKGFMKLVKENIGYVKIALYIMLALALLSVITSSMLIHGVRRDRRGLLLPFIIQEVFNIIISLALAISVAVLFGVPEALLGIILGVAGGCLFELYFLLVVISQYQALGLLRMHEEISMK